METNYIENIKDETESPTPVFARWQMLASATFAFSQPFLLRLFDSSILEVDEVIRLIPQRRMTVFGKWQGKPVVAKIFFGSNPRKQLEKEVKGIDILETNKIPTPAIYHYGTCAEERLYVLISERIKDGKNLQEFWNEKANVIVILPLLQVMMLELATQHVLGVTQHDLHLKNFLVADKRIYTLDGAEIASANELLSKKDSMENLALFFSQFGLELNKFYDGLFKVYAQARAWIIKEQDFKDLNAMILQCNITRWQQFSKKIYRDATDFKKIKRFNSLAMINRQFMHPAFSNFFMNPEDLFKLDHVMLKDGGSSTVIKVNIADREFVVKRYNVKNIWHFLRRAFRSTRANTTWRMAHKLALFGVQTAMPIAFIEKSFLGLRTASYSISEYIPGTDAQQFFSSHATDDPQTVHLIKSITVLLKNFSELKLTHGDLKLTNILINQKLQPIIIDLDGTIEHKSNLKLRRIYRKEIKRFLRNFKEQPYLQDAFAKELS